MKLVKDLNPSGIVYFWINDLSEQISPDIPTFQLAEEWRTRFIFSQYEGNERRTSVIDRRKDQDQRLNVDRSLDASRSKPEGRREADSKIQIDIDLAVEKLKVYYS